MRRIMTVLVLVCALALWVAIGNEARSANIGPAAYKPGELVVKLKTTGTAPANAPGRNSTSAVASKMQSVLSAHPALAGAKLEHAIGGISSGLVKLPEGLSVEQAIEILKKRPDVEWVEPNYKVRALIANPNDYYYFSNPSTGALRMYYYDPLSFPEIYWPYMWTMETINARGGWSVYPNAYYSSANPKPLDAIRVAVIDSGIDYDHPDFINAGASSTNITDGGQIDWANSCSILGGHVTIGPGSAWDDNGHGTHVSGIIAASANNGIGVAGVGYNACIVPMKIIDENGQGDDYDLAIAMMHAADSGIPIINMSVGTDMYSNLLAEAANYAYYNGCLLVAAANESASGGGNLGNMFPAAHSKVLAVTATGIEDDFAHYYAGYGQYVDIAAPAGNAKEYIIDWIGMDLPVLTPTYSTAPTYPVAFTYDQMGNPFMNYAHMLGTSMATPHVSGLAALYAAYKGYSTATPGGNLAIWRAIQRGADAVPGSDAYGGWSAVFGFGRINAGNTMQELNARGATRGSISGQTFYIGLPQGGFTLVATRQSDGYNRPTTAQEWGLWRIPNLPEGTYDVLCKNLTETITKTIYNVEVIAGCDTPGVDIWVGSFDDPTAPTTPKVTYDLANSTSTTLSAQWWSVDYETGIERYEVSVGTSAGGTNILAWTNKGLMTGDTFDTSAAEGRACFVNVRAINGGGRASGVGIPNTVSGKVIFSDYTGVPPSVATIEYRKAGFPTPVAAYATTLGTDGSFNLPAPAEPFKISVKTGTWLRRTVDVDCSGGNVSGVLLTLKNGDCNGDNVVNAGDLIQLRQAYGSTSGSSGWNVNADLNGDGIVNAGDLIIMRKNYGSSGDQ